MPRYSVLLQYDNRKRVLKLLMIIKRIVIIITLLLTVGPYENIDTDAAKERFLGYKQEIVDIVSPFDVYMNYNYADSNGSVRASFR